MKYIVLLVIFSAQLVASTPTNLEVITTTLDSLVAKSLPFTFKKTIKIESDNPLLTRLLKKSIQKQDSTIKITESDDYGSTIIIDSMSISYLEGSDERIIFVKTTLVSYADDHIVDFPFSHTNKDVINFDNISSLEDESFSFTIGKMIQEESSFWDDALEPAVYVTAAAVAIYLLFTIRSK